MERSYRGISVKERLDRCKSFAKAKGGKCLSDKYVNTQTKLDWMCSEGHIWMAAPTNIIYKGKWCPECSGNKKLTLQHAIDLAKKKGGECLSLAYVNSASKLDWKCQFGHEWSACYNNIHHGSWCPYCICLFGETVVRLCFEKLFEERFVKIRPSWLSGLELDGYAENIGIAFEYNGPQHTDRDHVFYEDSIITRDQLKRKLCKDNGVLLLNIDYVERNEIHLIKNSVMNKLHEFGFRLKEIDIDESQIYPYKIEECKILAKQRGGKCLSESYLGYDKKLKWECSCGNVWETTMYVISKGHWCPSCGNKRKK